MRRTSKPSPSRHTTPPPPSITAQHYCPAPLPVAPCVPANLQMQSVRCLWTCRCSGRILGIP
eukprot:5809688-Prymnesium_polylepis.1